MLGARAKVGRTDIFEVSRLFGDRGKRGRVILHLLQISRRLHGIGTGS
jgi:hypothetical protein